MWYEVLTIIGVMIGLFSSLSGLIIWMVNKRDKDINNIFKLLDHHTKEIDELYLIVINKFKEGK